jgi:hypothetical protein
MRRAYFLGYGMCCNGSYRRFCFLEVSWHADAADLSVITKTLTTGLQQASTTKLQRLRASVFFRGGGVAAAGGGRGAGMSPN